MISPIFADVETLVVDYLRSRLGDFPFEWSDISVRAVSRADRGPDDDPELTVRCEESAGDPLITQRATVRVTAWAEERDDAKEIARLAHAGLIGHPGDADVLSVRQVEGVVVEEKGEHADRRASFSVLVAQRPSRPDQGRSEHE
ncbi:hypothetical protein ACFW3Z_22625 [Nocardiopsis alba]|jgi:hypothetical protein|uniref:hypothetical protein n=1 Tax=Nocardiopsis alba TaxID=53437 RepID=UPI0033AC9A66